MIRFLLVAVATFILVGCKSRSSAYLFSIGDGPVEIYHDSISFTREARLIIMPVTIGGETYRFLFDTGAPMVISSELAKKLEMEVLVRKQVNDSQGKRNKLEYVALPAFTIRNQTFSGYTAIAADLNLAPALGCLRIDGILGANMMRDAIWEIDYQREVMRFTNDFAQFVGDTAALVLPFSTKSSGTPVIDLKIDSVTVKNVTFDTGSGGFFGVNKRLAPSFSADRDSNRISYGYHSQGLFGSTADTVYYTQKTVTIADSAIVNFPMKIQKSKNSKLLGTRYFENFKLTLNWQEKKAYLLPVGALSQRESWGLTPYLENDTLYVGTLVYGSEADKAGIKQGDRITAINGLDCTAVTNEDYCHILKVFKDDEMEKIELKVAGKESVTITLASLL